MTVIKTVLFIVQILFSNNKLHFQRLTNTKTISSWEEAEYLDLSNNSLFSSLYLRAFLQQMPNLKRIDLDGNYLTEVVEDLFASNPALEFLNFLNNRVTAVPERLFANNPELEVVWFSGNKLSSLPQNLFRENRNLLFVDFSRNFIKKMPRYLFRSNFFLDEVCILKDSRIYLFEGAFRSKHDGTRLPRSIPDESKFTDCFFCRKRRAARTDRKGVLFRLQVLLQLRWRPDLGASRTAECLRRFLL